MRYAEQTWDRVSRWIGPTDTTRQTRRDDHRAMMRVALAQRRDDLRAAKRKERGIAGGSRARQFTPIDMTIEAVRKAWFGALNVKPNTRRRGVLKCARRLYRGKEVARSWRSYPREPAVQIDGRIVL